MATVAVVYPSGKSFDLDYYLSTHMPLVSKTWTSYGLKSWEIIQYQGGEYQIQAILKWDSLASWENAPKDEVLGDIPNFAQTKPIILTGDSKATFTA